ncbi:hypothetical protein [Chitinimonas naiadis]
MTDLRQQLGKLGLRAQLYLHRHGGQGLLGGLLVAGAVLAWATLPLAEQSLVRRQAALASTSALLPTASPHPGTGQGQYDALYQVLDQGRDRQQDLQQLFDMAEQEGWDLAEADYSLNTQGKAGLQRLQIQLPLTGSYADIRDLAKTLLRGKANLSLDDLSFKRESAEQSNLNATLKLSLWSRIAISAPEPAATERKR